MLKSAPPLESSSGHRRRWSMSIKNRIRALQIVVSLVVVAMAAFVFVGLDATNYNLDRGQAARRQLAANSQLAIDANRYSEQIAELLLVGEPERPDFDSARNELVAALAEVRQAVEQEENLLRTPGERAEEQLEAHRLDRMVTLFGEIDRAVERLLLLDQQGRREEAIALFRSDIENRLDAEFAQLISDGLDDERNEVRLVESNLVTLTGLVRNTTLAALAVLLVISLISSILFARSIQLPIKRLTQGTLAIARGDLDHRIAHQGGDELAILSQRFNAMAEQLGEQRATIIATQAGLERQVEERTEQLAEANRRLVAIDDERVRLLADVNHELRTPLSAIRGEAEVALRGASKSETEYRRALGNVVSRSEELARLVDDLLFLARAEADEIRFHFQPVDLNELARQAVTEAQVLGRERHIRFELSPAAADLEIRGDASRLRQLLLIVFDNAAKYADAGTVVDVELREESKLAVLCVRDHGTGIAAEEVPHLFERFYRGASARHQWSGGTGLGLPIARWIAEKHKGTIELESVIGRGTEVVMRFPTVS
jgi:two-component system, OmpR family, sensor kinase